MFIFSNSIDTKAIVGDMYLRECESRYMAVDQFRRAVAVRGILQVPLEADECGFDGNYGLTTLQEENMYVYDHHYIG